ncbi:MAG: holo-[acyl-carrier-protein] synthase [Desulfovibrio fairfieldensis]|uniref:holo-[acyl-carrier-protein] synthase n=1 Tax=Desulfovibrio sp. 6_1_46AFAA TaxID=665942 RepID=UPI00022371F0|nr:holo-[acyl-carrier-protein] synthase [Desulfovibrio sp. 6_1_46AFAA]EGW52611.1 holo-(acyl-carrier-protein) synthase [Desulfovibrio sp. 6_1_46AFAA]MEE0814554.1 holo-[acyl-carrier-protein] synthase [Desulfovibrio fairfieldensis]
MIVGLGIDIAEMARLAKVYDKFGRRFLEKILTPAELAALPAQALPYIAGRFAAKEAAVKALGTGFSQDIGPRQIETGRTALGEPLLRFLDQALERAQSLGVRHCRLSISHERSVAVAVVILEA